MDIIEVEENAFVAGEAKLHGEMYRALYPIVSKLMGIFPLIEATRPRSKSGIQALCSLHVSLDRAKSLLQHCSDCSKLYLAITGESILTKFEKARNTLQESLRRVEDIVTEHIGRQIMEIVTELEEVVFIFDQSEKEAGDELINLLQTNRKSNSVNSSESRELEIFHQAALKLGITSSRAVLTERRALKKLIERARSEDDKRKESIVSYLYHLVRKYSKHFRSEIGGDDTDSQGSAPCSPTVLGYEDLYGSNLSKIRSFNFRVSSGVVRSGFTPTPPEELRCPISLQLMYDPVIISSGQTYERVCIEKWFSQGHSTCPKTQQELEHLGLTPNYCVKGLIASWCEHNGVPIPDTPPENVELNWKSAENSGESCVTEETEDRSESLCNNGLLDGNEGYRCLLALFQDGRDTRKQYGLVERIRYILKDDDVARVQMGANGFVEALVRFLRLAVYNRDEKAQEIGAMALFNLAVNNNTNKELLLSAGVIELLEQMISNPQTNEPATALYLNLSCLDEAKSIIGSSRAIPSLIQQLHSESDTQSKHDSLYTLYYLSTHQPNIPCLLSSGILEGLFSLLTMVNWSEKALAVLINLASTPAGRREILSSPGLVGVLATILDTGELAEQEHAVSCLLVLCQGDEKCIPVVLQEGVVPSLVSISVNGTARGREKAQKLLKLFREQRQRESYSVSLPEREEREMIKQEKVVQKVMCKSRSKKFGRTLSSIWKNRGCAVYQC